MIFVKNERSVGRNSKEIEKYFERGPEIQKVVKKNVNYNRFVKVGSKGPASRMVSQKRFQRNSEGLKVFGKGSK